MHHANNCFQNVTTTVRTAITIAGHFIDQLQKALLQIPDDAENDPTDQINSTLGVLILVHRNTRTHPRTRPQTLSKSIPRNILVLVEDVLLGHFRPIFPFCAFY